ncbi:unnamed protein product [Rotaria sordida]|uniref:RING-type domain-containing protein n=1 Tax=Rotaria sordida TaxID=392033 RepID=A0A813YSU0_9BILA|nr:unnamed protein product [Rotaria sordida]
MKRLFDETESIIKRHCLLISFLSTSDEINEPEEEIIINEHINSLNSQNDHNDNDSIEIIPENMNSTCQQTDHRMIILSDSDSDDDQIIDVNDNNNFLSRIPTINTLISSPHNELIENNETNIENIHELIDLTDDESNSSYCSSNKLECQSSIDIEECPICLETFTDLQYTGVYLIITQCSHIMCTLCSRQLLAISSRCPLCRENINSNTLIPYCIMALATIQASYDDDDDDNEKSTTIIRVEKIADQVAVITDPTFSVMSRIKLDLAPIIAIQSTDTSSFLDIKTREVLYNPKFEDMYAAVVIWSNKSKFAPQQQRSYKNLLNGYAESTTLSDFQFENQRRTFDSFGYAADPSLGEYNILQMIGDQTSAEINQGMTIFETSKKRSGEKRKKEKNNDPSDVEGFHGPWAPFVDEITVSRPSEEEQKEIDEYLAKKRKSKRPTFKDRNVPMSTRDPESTTLNNEPEDSSSTTLHIKDPYDYQGRSFLHIPQDLWEFYNERRCIRTYAGHSQAVRDVNFNNTGTEFLSASYDKMIKLWDTETGQVKSKFSMRKIPYCVSFNPSEHKQHLFICGMSDKKILCFDIRSGHVVQEYDRHLGAINTVTFVDRNRRIVSTADDKNIRVWEWNIPVDFKYIADPTMHSMPAVAQSRNGFVCLVSGYACGLDFSPDMSYLISGDADGHLIIWDWKTTRIFERIKTHDDVCIDATWHWHEKSRVLTAGWDNVVKLWD